MRSLAVSARTSLGRWSSRLAIARPFPGSYRSPTFNGAGPILPYMDGPGKSSSVVAGCVAIAALVGIMLVEVITNRPKSFVAIPSVGRVCQALYLNKYSGHWFYYTTPGACHLSWGFAFVLLIACLMLAADH